MWNLPHPPPPAHRKKRLGHRESNNKVAGLLINKHSWNVYYVKSFVHKYMLQKATVYTWPFFLIWLSSSVGTKILTEAVRNINGESKSHFPNQPVSPEGNHYNQVIVYISGEVSQISHRPNFKNTNDFYTPYMSAICFFFQVVSWRFFWAGCESRIVLFMAAF